MSGPRYHFEEGEYRKKINSPSTSPEYFAQFIQPLIEKALQERSSKSEDSVKLLDLACGHATALKQVEHIPGSEELEIFGIDLSAETLEKAEARFDLEHPNMNITFIAHDAEENLEHPEPSSIDIGIAINAMAYKQAHMLKTLFNALKPGGKCVINFFIPGTNTPYIEYYQSNGCSLKQRTLDVEVDGFIKTYHLLVTDFANYPDEQLQKLGQQAFFQSIEDIRDIAEFIGFEVDDEAEFSFHSEGIGNRVHNNVLTLKKPESPALTDTIAQVRERVRETVDLEG